MSDIELTEITFKPLFGAHSDELNHSNSAEFMSKIIYIIKKVINEEDKKHLYLIQGSPRKGEDFRKSTSRIKIYSRLLNKFIPSDNMFKMGDNELIFYKTG